jgi:hypothetical protein
MDLSQYTFARIDDEDVDLYVGKCVRVFNAIERIAGLNYAQDYASKDDEPAYENDVRAAIPESLHPMWDYLVVVMHYKWDHSGSFEWVKDAMTALNRG